MLSDARKETSDRGICKRYILNELAVLKKVHNCAVTLKWLFNF